MGDTCRHLHLHKHRVCRHFLIDYPLKSLTGNDVTRIENDIIPLYSDDNLFSRLPADIVGIVMMYWLMRPNMTKCGRFVHEYRLGGISTGTRTSIYRGNVWLYRHDAPYSAVIYRNGCRAATDVNTKRFTIDTESTADGDGVDDILTRTYGQLYTNTVDIVLRGVQN